MNKIAEKMNGKTKAVTSVSLGLIVSLAIGYGVVKGNVTHNTKDIVEIKTNVVKNTEDIDLEENVNIEQSVLLEQMQQNQLKFIEEFRELQKAK